MKSGLEFTYTEKNRGCFNPSWVKMLITLILMKILKQFLGHIYLSLWYYHKKCFEKLRFATIKILYITLAITKVYGRNAPYLLYFWVYQNNLKKNVESLYVLLDNTKLSTCLFENQILVNMIIIVRKDNVFSEPSNDILHLHVKIILKHFLYS